MDITEVKVFLKDSPDKKLKAYATVTFDSAFVVRNIKVIQGTAGLFIAMPSRKVRHPCLACGAKNEIRSRFCSQCAASLPQPQRPVAATAEAGSQAEHKDIAHPITQAFRELLQKKVLAGYDEEVRKGPAAARATGDE